ncbi:hypothetical protein [Acrocarpospora catenulata]|uniref:hypothetical protein n=1 Tax=Acrocarpospora catenulata TaxID=2836182 RepID=UPI001BDA2253|nr:hypothetical protein [Acrocarpospora catenulata]
MILIMCRYGDSDGHVGRYRLDQDGCAEVGWQKYLVTSEEVETHEGTARVARLIWD